VGESGEELHACYRVRRYDERIWRAVESFHSGGRRERPHWVVFIAVEHPDRRSLRLASRSLSRECDIDVGIRRGITGVFNREPVRDIRRKETQIQELRWNDEPFDVQRKHYS